MKVFSLQDFFTATDYDWKKDEQALKTIAYYTKTRHKPKMAKTRPEEMVLDYGTEQTFLVKAIAEYFKTTWFFEIGTGRGTACYALSLVDNIKSIHTVDILKPNQKFPTAIGYNKANVSLNDIRSMIPYKEKNKVVFHHRSEFPLKALNKKFDLAFIDGDHTNKAVILEDYAVCQNLLMEDGLILWDDYDPNKFAVKGIVDELLEKDKSLNAILVEQRGHLFGDKGMEKGCGVVIMRRGKIV